MSSSFSTVKNIIKNTHSSFRWRTMAEGVYCFNYHRIGEPEAAEFDPNVYSCTAATLSTHLDFIQTEFELIGPQDLLRLKRSGRKVDQRYAIITFDDGYLDNYTEALPVLESHNAEAIFFVVYDFIEKQTLAWWDEVAWLVKNTEAKEICGSNWGTCVSLHQQDLSSSIRQVLAYFKKDVRQPIANRLSELRKICGFDENHQIAHSRQFMDWTHLKELVDRGMSIGSHGMSHHILSQLSAEDQLYEVQESKLRLAYKLNCDIECIAYPVGSESASNFITEDVVKQSGYDLGFTFVKGINHSLDPPYNLRQRRISIDGDPSVDVLKQYTVQAASL